jgi:prophage regulatory protein
MSQISNSSVKLLRLPAVMEMTGLGRSTVYKLVQAKKFPEPVHVAVPKMTVWPSDVVEQWVQTQLDEGRG